MLFIISAVGVIGGLILGLDGLMLGSAGQLERIAAIASFALSAAGLVGLLADDGRRERRARHRDRVEHGDVLHVIAVAPIMALSLGAFLATLVPAIYVMMPFFALWYYASATRASERERGRASAVAPQELGHPVQVSAYP
jgi:hypothetical protein